MLIRGTRLSAKKGENLVLCYNAPNVTNGKYDDYKH